MNLRLAPHPLPRPSRLSLLRPSRLLFAVLLALTASCGSVLKQVEGTLVDVAQAACDMLETQDEPGIVKAICTVVQEGKIQQVLVRMPAQSPAADALRQKKQRKEAK